MGLSGLFEVGWLFPCPFGQFFSYYLFRYFLRSFLSLFCFWDPYNMNVGTFNCCPRGLLDCPHFFQSFFVVYSIPWQWFLPFCLSVHSFVPFPQLFCYWFLPVYFHFSYCNVHLCLFSVSSLNISCIFSISASSLFLSSSIIFTVSTLSSFFR